MSNILEIDGALLELNDRRLLSDIYLACRTGAISGLLGRNGQGKSCLMKIMYGTLQAQKSVRINGRSVLQAYNERGLISYLPQFSFIPTSLRLRGVLRDFGLDFHPFQHLFPEFTGRENSRIYELSGGERRLIEMYLVIKSNSLFAMLDEPFTHLSPIQIEKAKALLQLEKLNKGMLISDHMYQHVVDICDDLYVLAEGKTTRVESAADLARAGYINIAADVCTAGGFRGVIQPD